MSEFRKGQLVAVGGDTFENRRIRIFCGYYSTGPNDGETWFLCREAGESEKDAIAWPRCVPLEDVEPGAFLAKESKVFLNAVSYAGFFHREANEKDRQIQWLCKRLVGEMVMAKCPPGMGNNCCKDCEFCWELASRKAAMDATEEDEEHA